ncbi:HNH endonuclease [Pseudoxanthomonas sp. F37]|uniref:HNH endonuclease n=1 Tax=Pseudoxanthomonas sp. F37 TaxID=2932492 RepID=UPI001FD14AF9|nr:HNH endonuclease [Pseudoxanthomonas sp. F37]UOV08548.1 HNH endonuclease [Pseudoxanthomonas sp. F37]
MITCIYCPPEAPARFPIGKGSLEHVILAALGGRKGTRNLCCSDCNARLGSEIDDVLANTLAPLGNLFDIKRDRKGTAPTLTTDQRLDGAALEVAPGGKFQLRKATIEESATEDGRIILRGRANSMEQADRLRANYSQKFDGPIEAETEYELISTPAPELNFHLSFESPAKRCATKMLLSQLATCVNPERIRSGAFHEAIGYIVGRHELGYRVEPWLNMQVPEVPSEFRFGHIALVAASAETKKVVGVLTLYGTFQVTAVLSDAWSGPSVGSRYCIDPCTGKNRTEKFDPEPYVQTHPLSGRPDDAVFKAAMDEMLEEVLRRQHTARFLEAIRQVRESLPSDATAEQINQALAIASQRLTFEILRLPFRETLSKTSP